jgi:lysophospholipase L1-like esterase
VKGIGIMRILNQVVLTAVMFGFAVQASGQQFALHDGDRVGFYGDSITAQRLYTRFVEDAVLTRYPGLRVQFRNAGVPGDTVYGGYTGDVPKRLARDLFPLQPTVVTVMLGMNDGYYMPFNEKYLEIFKEGYRKLDAALAAGAPAARFTLISPTPYDEVTHGTEFAHYNEVISRHAEFVKELAASSHMEFSDFHRETAALLQRGMQKDPRLAALLVPDRIHPAETAHWIMAATLLRAWHMSPVVSKAWIHAAALPTGETENTDITGIAQRGGTLEWMQTDRALPLPLALDDGMTRFVLAISDLDAIDLQMLRVDGLTAPRYALSIDGKRIVSLTREQWAAGVNLALYATPMEDQAKGVDGIELKRTRLDEARFILDIEEPAAAHSADAIKAIEEKDTALAAEQRKAAQPKAHRFELSPE